MNPARCPGRHLVQAQELLRATPRVTIILKQASSTTRQCKLLAQKMATTGTVQINILFFEVQATFWWTYADSSLQKWTRSHVNTDWCLSLNPKCQVVVYRLILSLATPTWRQFVSAFPGEGMPQLKKTRGFAIKFQFWWRWRDAQRERIKSLCPRYRHTLWNKLQ